MTVMQDMLATRPSTESMVAWLGNVDEALRDRDNRAAEGLLHRPSWDAFDESLEPAAWGPFDGLPAGAPLSRSTLARLGFDVREGEWLRTWAAKSGAVVAARPRPAAAAAWARLGVNAKPLALKEKSVSALDCAWLGYDPRHRGLLVMRPPVNPLPVLAETYARGAIGARALLVIVQRYRRKRADYAGWPARQARLNADGGFWVRRYGRPVRTTVSVNDRGVVRLSHNRRAVGSDIDLYHVYRCEGGGRVPVSQEVMARFVADAGRAIDVQHGASVNAPAQPTRAEARKRNADLAAAHARGGGGGPLVVFGAGAVWADFVDAATTRSHDHASGHREFPVVYETEQSSSWLADGPASSLCC